MKETPPVRGYEGDPAQRGRIHSIGRRTGSSKKRGRCGASAAISRLHVGTFTRPWKSRPTCTRGAARDTAGAQ